MSENILYESSFRVKTINHGKYDKVSRVEFLNTSNKDTQIQLDINTELYPVQEDDEMTIALALSLNLDGSKDDSKGWRNVGRGEQTLADEYDYVMHGKIYRFEEGDGDNIHVYCSFGGLLMYIDGPYSALNALRVDNIYMLMKR